MNNRHYINFSKVSILLIFTLLCSSFEISEWQYEKNNRKKISKSIVKILKTNNYIIHQKCIKEKTYFYTIKQENSIIGYLSLSQAPSKFHEFDYYIIYNSDTEILKIEILKYRENYGMEICNKRWLEKFSYISTDNYNEYNNKIDGISGATISVNSLKKGVFKARNNLKKSIANNSEN